ncbi:MULTISPECIES: NAD(P)/FAD-dependent oxidoreductase [Prauserella salsuginis group]|uniref:D-amino-acid dehydrogenase n=2 Tax=Prauserella salsuginis group TaxID=2893672 RepID=A0A839XFR8_9PSEU|nr:MULTISPECIES: FAD-dependent oxidoreductase [Prauserella salsuginis group]MBB3661277.1 D-amino-acid dehydrogenase [Prauserella sediminis]MCR3719200.1 D-amino-acid dehydrogenase [Prauserella flava]MCR3735787.1 D-amino-acid dehydrogenase [Prauserella salsuginis]
MRIVIIGSGIAGAGTAWQLARRGADVVVVDADHAGRATAAGAGIVSPWNSRTLESEELAFHAEGAAYYRTLVDDLAAEGAGETSFAIVGGLVVSPDETWLREFHGRALERARRWPEMGEVSLLDPAGVAERMPLLAPDLGAVHIAGGGRIDGRTLRETFLAAAAARGARLRSGTAELEVRSGRVVGVRVAGDVVEADGVVLAAGAWTASLAASLGVTLPVEPQRGQISHFGVGGPGDEPGTASWPVVSPVGSGHYMLAFPDSRVVAGATRETGSGFDHRVTAEGQREVLSEALAVAPGLADATLLETRVGFRPVTPDGRPVIGALEAHPEVTVLTGFGAGGLTIGPNAARLAAAAALGERPDIPELFRPERFDGAA